MRRSLVVLVVCVVAGPGCSVEPVELEGKACPCGDGYRCVEGRCTRSDGVPEAGQDGGADAGAGACGVLGPSPPPRLAAGTRHTCAIQQGQLWCWGWNDQGQLGLGDQVQRDFPARVGDASDWVAVSGGEAHTCGIRLVNGFGSLYCWGGNTDGQLGIGGTDARLEPALVTPNVGFQEVAAGAMHTCALEQGGTLWCWGRQQGGAVGLGVVGPPAPVPMRVSDVDKYVELTAGLGHNCALRGDASLWCWGHFECFQLGSPDHELAPHRVDDRCWRGVAAGSAHSCAILDDGQMLCFGANAAGQLGIGVLGGGEPGYEGCLGYVVPQAVVGDKRWKAVAAGTMHTCGITEGGELWCWGFNEQRQVADTDQREEPTPLRVGTQADWIEVEIGFFHTCARNASDEVYCVGGNEQGQQGTGDWNRMLTRVDF